MSDYTVGFKQLGSLNLKTIYGTSMAQPRANASSSFSQEQEQKLERMLDNVNYTNIWNLQQTGADTPPNTTRIQGSSRIARARFDARANLTELSAWPGS